MASSEDDKLAEPRQDLKKSPDAWSREHNDIPQPAVSQIVRERKRVGGAVYQVLWHFFAVVRTD